MRFAVVTLFPELLQAFLEAGVVGRASRNNSIEVRLENPRDYATDVHRTVDDRPFGGGPGMVMRAEPLGAAIAAAKKQLPQAKVIYLSPQGKQLTQQMLREWVGLKASGDTKASADFKELALPELILVAGRYEGVDERLIELYIDDEVSIGDYVLSGGEVAAMVVIDALSRLLPGVLGHPESAQQDSFGELGLLDHPHYTRPERFTVLENEVLENEASENEASVNEKIVPQVLLSGDHKAIAAWRREQSLQRTFERRPELLKQARLSEAEKKRFNVHNNDAE